MANSSQTSERTGFHRARLLLQGFIGGLIGGMLGGALWTGIAITADFPTSIFSIVVGICATIGVLLASSKQRTLPYQLICVGTTILGLLFGKYLLFYHIFSQHIISVHGQQVWDESGAWLFTRGIIWRYPDYIIQEFADVDMFFIGLVLGAAIVVMMSMGGGDTSQPAPYAESPAPEVA